MKAPERKYLPGVFKLKDRHRYRAIAYRDCKTVYIGTFETEEEANASYVDFTAKNPKAIPKKSTLPKREEHIMSKELIGTPWQGL